MRHGLTASLATIAVAATGCGGAPEIEGGTKPVDPTPAEAPADTVADAADTVAAAAEAPTDGGEPAELSVEIPDKDLERLEAQVRADLAAVHERLATIDGERLGPEDAGKLDDVRRLVVSAHEANDAGEIRAAATLAEKARLLAAGIATD